MQSSRLSLLVAGVLGVGAVLVLVARAQARARRSTRRLAPSPIARPRVAARTEGAPPRVVVRRRAGTAPDASFDGRAWSVSMPASSADVAREA